MQTIPFAEIDGRHARAASTCIALIVGLDRLRPEVASFLGAILAEADVDQEVAEIIARLEGRGLVLGRPFFDRACAGGDTSEC